ncbi:MAG TPA: DUF2939 domain-containing protein [Rhodopila sp.]|jgi:hypothetical protein|nr:DUF2939 domain-containing protein [Rhodopila sp.]
MRARWPLLAPILIVGVAYAAAPYVTLYRLGTAIRSADTHTLETLVDWPAVREGIKEDVCDLGTDEPAPHTGAALPPFGASFIRGIAANTIDQQVTPQALLAVTDPPVVNPHRPAGHDTERPPNRGADLHLKWAFFDSLTTFLVSLQPPGGAEPIKLELTLDMRHGEWRVQRVWLPAALLTAGART